MNEKRTHWHLKPWVVVLLLFAVLGPFGLPLLYKSPHFNRFWKITLTALTLLYTAYLVVATVQIIRSIASWIPSETINL